MPPQAKGFCRVSLFEAEFNNFVPGFTPPLVHATVCFGVQDYEQKMTTPPLPGNALNWTKTYEFQAYNPYDILCIRFVNNKDEVLLGKTTLQVGESSGGNSGDLWVPIMGVGNAETAVIGRLHLWWLYCVSTESNLFATPADALEPVPLEEFEITKLNNNISRLVTHICNLLTPFWYWMDTCMWKSPPETMFWILYLYCSVFVFDTVFRSTLPGLMLAGMTLSYYNKRRAHSANEKEEDTSATMVNNTDQGDIISRLQAQKEMLRSTQIWCGWISDHLDFLSDVYHWRDYSTAFAVTKVLGVWVFALMFLPVPSFRYFFYFGMMYMYVVYPASWNFPNLYAKYSPGILIGIAVQKALAIKESESFRKLTAALKRSETSALASTLGGDVSPDTVMTYQQFVKLMESRGIAQGGRGLVRRLSDVGALSGGNQGGQKGMGGAEMQRLGKLIVTVNSVLNVDKSSDRYITVKVRDQEFRTKTTKTTILQNSSIMFGETFTFNEMYETRADIKFELWEYSLIGKDKSIARATFPCTALVRDRLHDERIEFVNSKGRSCGQLEVKMCAQGFGIQEGGHSSGGGGGGITGAQNTKSGASGKVVFEIGNLRVCLERGWELKAMDTGGTSDPFVELRVGDQLRKSRIIKSTLNPEWNETFFFENVTPQHVLALHMYDWDAIGHNDSMGSASIMLSSLTVGEPTKKTLAVIRDKEVMGKISVEIYIENKSSGNPNVTRPAAVSLVSGASPLSPKGGGGGITPQHPTALTQPQFGAAQQQQAIPSVPANTRVKLSVVVKEASLGLKPDEGLQGFFVRVRLGSSKFKTHPWIQTSHPMWNERFTVEGIVPSTTTMEAELWASSGLVAKVTLMTMEAMMPTSHGNTKDTVLDLVPMVPSILSARIKMGVYLA
eukprot:PhF_6_TR8013/c0_g1_i1/m.12418